MSDSVADFIGQYIDALESNRFIKLSVGNPRDKDKDLKKLMFRLVKIKNEARITCVYTYRTKDITKNYTFEESAKEVEKYLGVDLKNATLFTIDSDIHLLFNKKMKGRIMKKNPTFTEPISDAHNKTKRKMIRTKDNPYLHSLGLTDDKGNINKNSVDKFKQINKYIETVDGILKSSELKNKSVLNIVDMGSGKGYLTFALYDYLTHELGKTAYITGVEQRPDLVQLCNTIAQENQFKGLNFSEGRIDNFKTDDIDILIALHACDTATDDAIYSGISSKASIIITAPCCHKQVRKQLNVDNELKEITQFGILEERQAEILTDTIRALVLESQGYKSQVFEFIADAHTHKNVMVVGTKKKKTTDSKPYLDKIDQLKSKFGIDYQHLEKKIRTKDSKK